MTGITVAQDKDSKIHQRHLSAGRLQCISERKHWTKSSGEIKGMDWSGYNARPLLTCKLQLMQYFGHELDNLNDVAGKE